MFYIGFTSAARVDAEGRRYAEGELQLGGESERFRSDLRFWSMRQYEEQWRQAVLRLAGGATTSALVTSYLGAEGHHSVWPLWRDGASVYVQERMVITDPLPSRFDPADIYDLVGERLAAAATGAPIREWKLPLGQLMTYAMDE